MTRLGDFLFRKDDQTAAEIADQVDRLVERGVQFEHYTASGTCIGRHCAEHGEEI